MSVNVRKTDKLVMEGDLRRKKKHNYRDYKKVVKICLWTPRKSGEGEEIHWVSV